MSNHHHSHRPHPLSLPPRAFSTSRHYPAYPVAHTPTPTPSKTKRRSFNNYSSTPLSFSSLFYLLFSLQPLYSILPFLQSIPSFSLFPFSFLVSLLAFLLSLLFFSFPKSKNKSATIFPIFPVPSLLPSLLPQLAAKSSLLALTFILRFQSLRSCGTGPTILAEFSGSLAAQFVWSRAQHRDRTRFIRGFFSLLLALVLLSSSWDRAACFPFNGIKVHSFSPFFGSCIRILPMLLPFLCGFLGYYERSSTNWGQLRSLGRKRVRVISLFLTTLILLVPAILSFSMAEGDTIFVKNLGWPLLNTVIFGVILSESYAEDKFSIRDLRKEFAITFVCTLILELFYFPELSLFGYLLCGFLLWISVNELGSSTFNYLELGSDTETFSSVILNPIRHILSERKSRKIALFLLINTAYMVVEFVAGFMSNSLGLISDACHMLFDCAALAIGLYASYISRLPANDQFNYGRGRFEVLSGYVNAVLLVLVGALIVLESFERILDPQEISTSSLLVVSIGGLMVNVVGLIFFHEEHHHAHGGTGPCSHSHHHHHHHHHSHLDDHVHSHEHPHDNQEGLSTSTGACHGKSCEDDHHDHGHDNSNHNEKEKLTLEFKQFHSFHGSSHDDNLYNHDHHTGHSGSHREVVVDKSICEHDHLSHNHQHGHDLSPVTAQWESHSHNENPSAEGNIQDEPHIHHHIDHNMEGIFLHVLADTMGSVGVVLSTLLIKYKGWLVADPACSIFISVMIIASVIPLLRNSAEILLQRVPRAHEKVLKEAFAAVANLRGVHHLQNVHVWNLTNTDVVGTLHLRISAEIDKGSAKERVSRMLHDAGIKDLVLQVEYVKGK
ncbi:uncharacterized protein [Aristolochia californica]|uniref:uncharacterized protein n=1 Tax=Aristolochia californica TaxID=171875 RepID=UPI0035E340D9